MSVSTVGAVLTIDVGSLHTRAAIFDIVGDEYRFIARATVPTTAELPANDIAVGVTNALAELEQITGRKLSEQSGVIMPQRRNGSGVDLVIATSSAAPALRLVVAAVSGDISQLSATQAAQSTYTHILSYITLDEGIGEIPGEEEALRSTAATAWLQRQTEKLLALPPEIILISGGVDDGPTEPLVRLARVISGAAQQQGTSSEQTVKGGGSAPGMPSVVYAGNSLALESVKGALAPVREVRAVPNVRPDLFTEQTEPASAEISNLYNERRLPQLPGFSTFSRAIEGHLVPTAECEYLVARYLHAFYGRETLIADVGATSTSLFLANADRSQPVVHGEIGLAFGLGNLLAERGAANVLKWLPFDISAEELTDWALNKMIRPLSLPLTVRDLAIEQAFAREAMATGAEALQAANGGRPPRYDLLIGTGGCLANAPKPGQVALMLLDAMQPTAEGLGSVELAVDTTLLVPAIGNLARHQPEMASAVFDRDCLVWLGTAIIVQGEMPESSANSAPAAVTVTIERKGGEPHTVEVPFGEITVVPLRSDQRAALTVKPGPVLRVGGGEPGKPLKTQAGQEVKGGLVGLIIDARGRPMRVPTAPDARATLMRRWLSALDASPDVQIASAGRTGDE